MMPSPITPTVPLRFPAAISIFSLMKIPRWSQISEITYAVEG